MSVQLCAKVDPIGRSGIRRCVLCEVDYIMPDGIGLYVEGSWSSVCTGCCARIAPQLLKTVSITLSCDGLVAVVGQLRELCDALEQAAGAYACSACDAEQAGSADDDDGLTARPSDEAARN